MKASLPPFAVRPLLAAALCLSLAGAACRPAPSPDPNPPRPTPTPAAPRPTPAPAPEKAGQARVEWITYVQRDVSHFEIFRADSPDGERVRVSSDDDYIPGEPGSAEPVEYSFLDTNLEPGRAYYYFIQEVGLTGRTRWRNRVPIRKVARLPGESAANVAN